MMLLLRNLIFTLLVPGMITIVIPYLIARRGWLTLPLGEGHWLGLIVLAAGVILYLLCIIRFGVDGKGTPAPIDPPRRLVIRGPYRVVRNPMYIAALCFAGGTAILFASGAALVYTAVLWLLFNLFILFYEEPTLKRMFGAEYEQYLKEVPRWLPRGRTE